LSVIVVNGTISVLGYTIRYQIDANERIILFDPLPKTGGYSCKAISEYANVVFDHIRSLHGLPVPKRQ